ncbi:MAG: hypothetical protein AAF998_23055 [Bacteroidota bacterium]
MDESDYEGWDNDSGLDNGKKSFPMDDADLTADDFPEMEDPDNLDPSAANSQHSMSEESGMYTNGGPDLTSDIDAGMMDDPGEDESGNDETENDDSNADMRSRDIAISITVGDGDSRDISEFFSIVDLESDYREWANWKINRGLEAAANRLSDDGLIFIVSDDEFTAEIAQYWIVHDPTGEAIDRPNAHYSAFLFNTHLDDSQQIWKNLLAGGKISVAVSGERCLLLASLTDDDFIKGFPRGSAISKRDRFVFHRKEERHFIIHLSRDLYHRYRGQLDWAYIWEIHGDEILITQVFGDRAPEILQRVREQRNSFRWGDPGDESGYIKELKIELEKGEDSFLRLLKQKDESADRSIKDFPKFETWLTLSYREKRVLIFQVLLLYNFPGLKGPQFRKLMAILLGRQVAAGPIPSGNSSVIAELVQRRVMPIGEYWSRNCGWLMRKAGIETKENAAFEWALAFFYREGGMALITEIHQRDPFEVEYFYRRLIRSGMLFGSRRPYSKGDQLRKIVLRIESFGGDDLCNYLFNGWLNAYRFAKGTFSLPARPIFEVSIANLAPANELEDRLQIILSAFLRNDRGESSRSQHGLLRRFFQKLYKDRESELIVKMLLKIGISNYTFSELYLKKFILRTDTGDYQAEAARVYYQLSRKQSLTENIEHWLRVYGQTTADTSSNAKIGPGKKILGDTLFCIILNRLRASLQSLFRSSSQERFEHPILWFVQRSVGANSELNELFVGWLVSRFPTRSTSVIAPEGKAKQFLSEFLVDWSRAITLLNPLEQFPKDYDRKFWDQFGTALPEARLGPLIEQISEGLEQHLRKVYDPTNEAPKSTDDYQHLEVVERIHNELIKLK